ncbi:hypothetical protein L1987_62978 [Smallanthus sonchifolius]|uniref:Uncharacterized protein n=1 Tax=Smallanthus sonchifolius TaxID=185202 RepID=A0ACB9CBZ5_9ASTR|nr:hypothetical protein L1987_62978 [Smallanthus sonchifolius]
MHISKYLQSSSSLELQSRYEELVLSKSPITGLQCCRGFMAVSGGGGTDVVRRFRMETEGAGMRDLRSRLNFKKLVHRQSQQEGI